MPSYATGLLRASCALYVCLGSHRGLGDRCRGVNCTALRKSGLLDAHEHPAPRPSPPFVDRRHVGVNRSKLYTSLERAGAWLSRLGLQRCPHHACGGEPSLILCMRACVLMCAERCRLLSPVQFLWLSRRCDSGAWRRRRWCSILLCNSYLRFVITLDRSAIPTSDRRVIDSRMAPVAQ